MDSAVVTCELIRRKLDNPLYQVLVEELGSRLASCTSKPVSKAAQCGYAAALLCVILRSLDTQSIARVYPEIVELLQQMFRALHETGDTELFSYVQLVMLRNLSLVGF